MALIVGATDRLIRNGLLTLTHSTAADGSPFTLVELPELLLNTTFRRFVTEQPTVPDSVRSFWIAYEQMSYGERAQVIGTSLNKLRSFTTRVDTRTVTRLGGGGSVDPFLGDELLTASPVVFHRVLKPVLG